MKFHIFACSIIFVVLGEVFAWANRLSIQSQTANTFHAFALPSNAVVGRDFHAQNKINTVHSSANRRTGRPVCWHVYDGIYTQYLQPKVWVFESAVKVSQFNAIFRAFASELCNGRVKWWTKRQHNIGNEPNKPLTAIGIGLWSSRERKDYVYLSIIMHTIL